LFRVSIKGSAETRRKIIMAEECRHGLTAEFCAYCRSTARGLPDRVLVTSAGQVFHLRRDCQALADGWAKSRRYGQEPTPLRQISLIDAQADRLGGCLDCCAELALGD
jgi:hypothetical protein